MNKEKLVVIESPLKGDFERNQRYARWCCRDAWKRFNERAFASHLLFSQFLNDEVPDERWFGLQAGFAWAEAAGADHVYYLDLCPVVHVPEAQSVPCHAPTVDNIGQVSWLACVEHRRLSDGMHLAWQRWPGECRLLSIDNPEFYQRFLSGENPPGTLGAFRK